MKSEVEKFNVREKLRGVQMEKQCPEFQISISHRCKIRENKQHFFTKELACEVI